MVVCVVIMVGMFAGIKECEAPFNSLSFPVSILVFSLSQFSFQIVTTDLRTPL